MIDKQTRLNGLENQIKRLEGRLAGLRATSDRYSWLRLGLFIGGVALSIAGFYFVNGWLGWPLLALTLVVFNVIAYRHRLLERGITRHTIWLNLKQAQVARIRLDWAKIPAETVNSPSQIEHPFEIDLDLTGERSIHRLLDLATTLEGSQRLRDWLLTTRPGLETTYQRQKIVRELVPLANFRDKLLLKARIAASDADQAWEGRQLLKWLELNAKSAPIGRTLVSLSVLALLNLVLLALSLLGLLPNIWVISFLIYVLLYNYKASDTNHLLDDSYTLRNSLLRLNAVLGFLESYNYRLYPELKKLCATLLNPQSRPSLELKRITRVANGAILQKNPILWPIFNAIFPLRFYLAYRLNQSKATLTGLLPRWLEVWYELEALNSLANFGYLNPEYHFPEIKANTNPPVLSGKGLGHPLIPTDSKVCNDFTLENVGELTIITGSNMSGKSSFLRTIGVNLCLAYAGGPVNAQSLTTTLFRLFTCIRVSDSVTDGFSYFYAEVRRLKWLLEEVKQPDLLPVFFLIDEIFRGTNNRERLIGSQSFLQALSGSHSAGMVSTHDLELIHLADNNPAIQNYHFREEVLDGQMVFDYKLRTGPSPTTNALKIMRQAGLPVPSELD